MDWKTFASIISPTVALLGIAITAYITYRGWKTSYNNNAALELRKYENAINLEKRKTELSFISDQIRYLYAPLMALYKTRAAAFDALMTLHGGDRRGFFDGTKLTSEDLRQWRLWRTEVLMPIVSKMEEAILQNGHLMEGTTVPGNFIKLLAHAASYKVVIKEWNDVIETDKVNDTDKINEQQKTRGSWVPLVCHTGIDNFPREIGIDVEAVLSRLKTRQAELMRITQMSSG
jgi:hypothetical protein